MEREWTPSDAAEAAEDGLRWRMERGLARCTCRYGRDHDGSEFGPCAYCEALADGLIEDERELVEEEDLYEQRRAAFERAMSPDPTKEGVFRDHNCSVCRNGALPCRTKVVGNCGNLFARND